MAKFSFIEKSKFEKLFGMSSGYVLDFSDRTFQEFISEALKVDIYDEKYNHGSGSKANRIRGYWLAESNYNIAKLMEKLLEYWMHKVQMQELDYNETDKILYEECLKIVHSLKSENPVENLNALTPNSDEKDFSVLAEVIKESIEKNEPEKALDRLHTFTIKYIRQLNDNHGIEYNKETPLHSLFGGYVKAIDKKGVIESDMTRRILKSSISILEAFNDIRNNKSFAHDNPILNYNESILIFNDISNVIRFLETVEQSKVEEKKVEDYEDDLPF